jgi:hypothetical protein
LLRAACRSSSSLAAISSTGRHWPPRPRRSRRVMAGSVHPHPRKCDSHTGRQHRNSAQKQEQLGMSQGYPHDTLSFD